MHKLIIDKFTRHLEIKNKITNETFKCFDKLCKISLKNIKSNTRNKIIFFGNGGSASDSIHFSAELVSKFLKKKRKSINAISLVSNISAITSISNDFNYNYIFKRQLESIYSKGDIVIILTTSGTSYNIIESIKFLNKQKSIYFLFSKTNGGIANMYSKNKILIPSDRTDDIQDFHYMMLHSYCEYLDKNI